MATNRANKNIKGDSTASSIRRRIESAGERFWTYDDFHEFPPSAVAKSLSRLAGEGLIERTGKGLYFRPRQTVLGKSKPSQTKVAEAAAKHKLHPAGVSAANALGFTSQNAGRGQYATTASNTPTKLRGAKVYTRRPAAREGLDAEEGAILEFLRSRGTYSDLSPEETARRLLAMLKDRKRFERLASAAFAEPPRVRALLGAIGEEAKQPKKLLGALRASLNPLTRFDFGPLRVLKKAKEWQAE